eukprot:Rmarinus@m.24682
MATAEDNIWLFGYGSLVWKQGFPYADSLVGCVRGWRRRFWQGSTDHRGVPGSPGRVVTLIPDHDEVEEIDGHRPWESNPSVTWGVAFMIEACHKDEVLRQLDFREKGGYTKTLVDVFSSHDAAEPVVKDAILYTGTTSNPNYLGPAAPEEISHTIAHSVGPSGPNVEYFTRLQSFMQHIGQHDEHVMELAPHVERVSQAIDVEKE